MTRPAYETEADLARELSLATKLEATSGYRFRKLPRRYAFDWAVLGEHDRVRGWAELKTRTTRFAQYPNFMISLSKVLAGLDLARQTGLPAYLIVAFSDGCRLLRLEDKHARLVGFGGRTDRSDPEDLEPVCLINLSDFKVMKEKGAA